MLGRSDPLPKCRRAVLGADLPANDLREDYLRAKIAEDENGNLVATPFARQDSSMLTLLATADALVVRPPHAPPAKTGDDVQFLELAAACG
jgi:molybdopterin molybdotransferase